ncbi:hypothetical protein OHA72_56430 [Dactylosporangium sp. NBC_01737]|uniref:hypothetical protein n=1 Tax=Dactylosporangium sp. NBC_01737 TaxID=2975959 RepID=UPI002E126004|nr:hypothetical protein OHA72_56430 [Dactylosporangium sp. NBC_01737]
MEQIGHVRPATAQGTARPSRVAVATPARRSAASCCGSLAASMAISARRSRTAIGRSLSSSSTRMRMYLMYQRAQEFRLALVRLDRHMPSNHPAQIPAIEDLCNLPFHPRCFDVTYATPRAGLPIGRALLASPDRSGRQVFAVAGPRSPGPVAAARGRRRGESAQ